MVEWYLWAGRARNVSKTLGQQAERLLSRGISKVEILGESNEDLALRYRTLSEQNALGVHLVETGVSSHS